MSFSTFKKLIFLATFIGPAFVSAQKESLNSLVIAVAQLIQNGIIPLLIGVALLVFLWGVTRYALSRDDESRKSSIGIMINGVIILFVMVAVWGLVFIISTFFQIDIRNNRITLPDKQINSSDLIIKQ